MKTNSAATLTVASIDLSIGLLQISLIFIGFISFVKNYEVPVKTGCIKKETNQKWCVPDRHRH